MSAPVVPGLDELARDVLAARADRGRVMRLDGSDGTDAALPCVVAIGAFDGCHRVDMGIV